MYKIHKLVSVMAIGASLLTTAPVMAGGLSYENVMGDPTVGNELGLSNQDVRVTVARIIRVAMGMLGILTVCIILIGGFTWMTAGGNDDKIVQAKKWIFSGIVGLAIILSSWAIATFVIQSLIGATA